MLGVIELLDVVPVIGEAGEDVFRVGLLHSVVCFSDEITTDSLSATDAGWDLLVEFLELEMDTRIVFFYHSLHVQKLKLFYWKITELNMLHELSWIIEKNFKLEQKV